MSWEYMVGNCHVCKTQVYIDDSIRVNNEEWFFPRYYCEECYKKNAKVSVK